MSRAPKLYRRSEIVPRRRTLHHNHHDDVDGVFEDRAALERLIFFSDAVFAIAITLLVIDIRVPNLGPAPTASQLTESLRQLEPSISGFLMSFLVIGLYWFIHHRTFRQIRRYDTPFVWLNILLLMSIAFLPFCNSLIGQYGNLTPAVVFYATSLTITGTIFLVLWLYAVHGHRLVDRNLDARTSRDTLIRIAVPPVIFLISIPLALVTSRVEFIWVAIPIVSRIIRRRAGGLG